MKIPFKSLIIAISIIVCGVTLTPASNVQFGFYDDYGNQVDNDFTLTLLSGPLQYNGYLAYGTPKAYHMTTWPMTVSNMAGGNWALGIRGQPKNLILAVPPNDTNTWNYTSLINSNVAYYAKLGSVFMYWPTNLDAWSQISPADLMGLEGITNLIYTNVPSFITNNVFYIDTNNAFSGYINVIVTNAVPNTNQLWASGAGTNQANGEYIFAQAAFGGGWIFTNVSGGGYFCGQLGGTFSPNYDQHPFWIGATTNNSESLTGTNNAWYFSSVAPTGYLTNDDDNAFLAIGKLPAPVVTYGTNITYTTNMVFENPAWFGAQYTNGIIYVSQSGNDLLASNLVCAFATCQAAKNFATAGMTIEVLPGHYVDHDLARNKVNWIFDTGSTLAWDEGQLGATAPRGIFDDYAGAVTSNVTLYNMHYTAIVPRIANPILTTNPLSRLIIEVRGDTEAAFYTVGDQNAYPGAPTAFASGYVMQAGAGTPCNVVGGYLVEDENCAYVSVKFDGLCTAAGIPNIQAIDSNESNAGGTYGTLIPVTNNYMGFFWNQGEEHISGNFFNFTNVAPSIGSGGPAQAPRFLWAQNTGSTESHLFITADHVEACGSGLLLSTYDDSTNPKARVWYNIRFYNAVTDGAFDWLCNDLIYYTGQKVGAYGDVIRPGNSGMLWFNCEKVTENGSGHWVNDSTTQTNFFSVQQWEDNSGGQMTSGFLLGKPTNSLSYFYGGVAIITNAPVLKYGLGVGPGGPVTFAGASFTSAWTNPPIWMLASNGLTLEGCTLHSSSAQGCIYATTPVFVKGIINADQYPTNFVHGIGTNFLFNTPVTVN